MNTDFPLYIYFVLQTYCMCISLSWSLLYIRLPNGCGFTTFFTWGMCEYKIGHQMNVDVQNRSTNTCRFIWRSTLYLHIFWWFILYNRLQMDVQVQNRSPNGCRCRECKSTSICLTIPYSNFHLWPNAQSLYTNIHLTTYSVLTYPFVTEIL